MSVETINAADAASLGRFDLIIDVRSPAEFAEDHMPGAINLPVLDDAERAQIGEIYVQQSRFRARRLGAALVARNIARHLETALADREGGFQPLVYCWRGGMRSGAMATILAQVGWRTALLAGGYRTYRRHVSAQLYDADLSLNFVLLDGPTGSAKTEVLQALPAQGLQILDLEGLAEHRGSLFGALTGRPQPSQKLFESRLLSALDGLDPARVVVAEAESSKIGDRMIPPALWRRLAAAPVIEMAAEPEARARYIARTYGDIAADPARLEDAFARLPRRPSPQRLQTWRNLVATAAFAELAQALNAFHYDPAYAQAQRKSDRRRLETISLSPDDGESRAEAATAVARTIGALDARPAR